MPFYAQGRMKMASDNDLAGMEVATNRPHDSHRRMSPFFFFVTLTFIFLIKMFYSTHGSGHDIGRYRFKILVPRK